MKVLGLTAALVGLAFSVSVKAEESPSPLSVTSLSDTAEKLESDQLSLIRSKIAFSTRAEAVAFCKSHGAVLADNTDILAAIVLNNSFEKQDINAGLNEVATYTVSHKESDEDETGFISWLSDADKKEAGISKTSEVIMYPDGQGFAFHTSSMKELNQLVKKNALSFDKTQLVAFCKK